MFHVVLSGKIVTSDDEALIKKIEDLIEKEDAHLEGLFVSYEVEEIQSKTDESCIEGTKVSYKVDHENKNEAENDTH